MPARQTEQHARACMQILYHMHTFDKQICTSTYGYVNALPCHTVICSVYFYFYFNMGSTSSYSLFRALVCIFFQHVFAYYSSYVYRFVCVCVCCIRYIHYISVRECEWINSNKIFTVRFDAIPSIWKLYGYAKATQFHGCRIINGCQ